MANSSSNNNSKFWQKQSKDSPLFPDLLWSRPENKANSGKLLIIGGNAHSFAAVGVAYGEAVKAGIGSVRIVLPDALQKTVGKVLPEGEYAPSSASGSFGQNALAELLHMSQWADATLFAGDFGRNSETAILLEKFTGKYSGSLVITQDAIDYFTKNASVLNRKDTVLVLSFAQLQKIAITAKYPIAFKYEMDFLHLVDALHNFTTQFKSSIVVKCGDNIFVANCGRVSATTNKDNKDIGEIWRVKTAASATVWWLQNPTKPYEALTTSLIKN